jgi:hypothetical protein
VAQRFLATQDLDEVVRYVFTFKMKPTPVRLRLLRSSSAKNMYVLVERPPA